MRFHGWQAWLKRTWRRSRSQPRLTHAKSGFLQDFYPGIAFRRKVHYLFAHCFLPQYLQSDPRQFFAWTGRLGAENFAQVLWNRMEEAYGLVSPPDPMGEGRETESVRRWLWDLKARTVLMDERTSLILVMPPAPGMAADDYPRSFVPLPLGLLIGIVRTGEDRARYFILEAASSGSEAAPASGLIGTLCEWTEEDRHETLGLRAPASDQGAFVAALRELTRMA
jgi:hypothetical protein